MYSRKNRQIPNVNDFLVLRDNGVISYPAPYLLDLTFGAWRNHANLTSVVIPFEEASRWTVYGEGRFHALGVTDTWRIVGLAVTYNLNGAGWTNLVENPNKHSKYFDNTAHDARLTSVSHSWRKAFAFVGPVDTIQFRLEFEVSATTSRLYYPMFYIDVARA